VSSTSYSSAVDNSVLFPRSDSHSFSVNFRTDESMFLLSASKLPTLCIDEVTNCLEKSPSREAYSRT
jgi:hypothetical protein